MGLPDNFGGGSVEKFVFLTDIHWGYERDGSRHKVPLHDERAVSIAMQFIADFKPDHVILGGDILDCGSVSHHRRGRVGQGGPGARGPGQVDHRPIRAGRSSHPTVQIRWSMT